MRTPAEGDDVCVFDRAKGEYDALQCRINAVMSRGIYGWIVELPDLRFIEVVPVPDSGLFRELRPDERNLSTLLRHRVD